MLIRWFFSVFGCFYLIGFGACQRKVDADKTQILFDSIPSKMQVNPIIEEASGIADSKKNAGYLWVQEDSGTPSEIYLLNHNGVVLKKVFVKGATNRDWEDMSLANGKIYIGETGDNSQTYPDYAFYIFEEPDKTIDTVYQFLKLSFRYPDGSHDAEAFLVEPKNNDIYILTKRDNPSRIYKLAANTSTATQTAEYVGQVNYTGITSAALSPDGSAILIKTYTSVLYFPKSKDEKIENALQKTPGVLPYAVEPQGEAICFNLDNSGYFTLSEKGFSSIQNLFFYKRK